MGIEVVLDDLVCPVEHAEDAAALRHDGASVVCAAGHRFDVARQGYVNLSAGRAHAAADTPAMVAARARLQEAGHHAPLTDALVGIVGGVSQRGDPGATTGLVVEVGAGTGHQLAAVVAATGARGLALDLSKHAARRAARVHPRVGAVVADIWTGIPIRDGAADVVLDVFAPRNPGEFARVVGRTGVLVVATPGEGHLAPLVDTLGLLRPARGKTAQLDADLAGAFASPQRRVLRWTRALDDDAVVTLVASGPSAHHLDAATVRRLLGGLPRPVVVTMEVVVSTFRRH